MKFIFIIYFIITGIWLSIGFSRKAYLCTKYEGEDNEMLEMKEAIEEILDDGEGWIIPVTVILTLLTGWIVFPFYIVKILLKKFK